MGYDLAVWEGRRPSTDAEGLRIFRGMCDQFMNGLGFFPPSARASSATWSHLLHRWPDIGTPGGEDSPWANGPLIDSASGDLVRGARRARQHAAVEEGEQR